MSNEVKFNIKLVVDGKEKIVDATADIKKFAQEFENARTESTKVRDELLKFTQTSQSIQNVITGMQQLTGVMGTYTAANSVQVEAETKLAVNMRNTMGAREEDIQSIKDLCSAQQQLGVIGDEVQLSGAQELATYLEKKSSLEKLIPVMNDMVAQQYGLNATEESATNIATMLGKVMEGQVGALSRYGYSFDKAQEEILKFGTEEQRVAVLSEVVESSVGGMNAELAKTDAGKAKQVSNALGDIKEQVGALFSSVEPLIVGVGELGVAFMSLGTTYSGLRGMVAGVQNLTSALNVSRVTAYAHSVAMKASASGIAVWRSVSVGAVAMTRALTAAFHGATVGATTLKVAIRGLMTATGVGLAVAALTLAIEKLFFSEEAASASTDELSDKSERLQQVLDGEKQAYASARSELDGEIAKLKELISSKGDARGAVEELNRKYGESFGYYQTAQAWYDTLMSKSEDYCRQLALEAKMKVLAAKGAEVDYDLEKNLREQDRLRASGGQHVERDIYGRDHIVYSQSMKDTMAAAKALAAERHAINDMMNEAQSELAETRKTVGTRLSPSPRVTPVTPHPVVGGVHEDKELSLISDPKSYADLKNNVEYYSRAIEKADKSDSAHLATLVEEKRAAEDLVRAFEDVVSMSGLDEGSSGWYENRLSQLRDRLRMEGDETLARGLASDMKAVEQEYSDYKIRVGIDVSDAKSPLEQLESALEEARERLSNAVSIEAKVEASADVTRLQEEIDAATSGKVTISVPVAPLYAAPGSDEDKRRSYDNAQQRAGRIQQDYEIGLIGKDEALAGIAELNLQLEELGLKPLEIAVMTEDVDKAKEKLEGLTDAVSSMGQGLSSLGESLEIPALNVAGVIAQAIATLAAGFAKASAESATLGPIAWLGFTGVGLAQLAAVIGSVKKLTAFADGGVVSGPTMALIGEYAGASHNPEVVAPLDKLRAMIDPGAGLSGRVRFEIDGRKLVGVIEKEYNHKHRV